MLCHVSIVAPTEHLHLSQVGIQRCQSPLSRLCAAVLPRLDSIGTCSQAPDRRDSAFCTQEKLADGAKRAPVVLRGVQRGLGSIDALGICPKATWQIRPEALASASNKGLLIVSQRSQQTFSISIVLGNIASRSHDRSNHHDSLLRSDLRIAQSFVVITHIRLRQKHYGSDKASGASSRTECCR